MEDIKKKKRGERAIRGRSKKWKSEMRKKKWEMVGWREGSWWGGLMCPSWGEAGPKWLSMKLNWLHYRGSAPESISDITRPSQTGSYISQREHGEQPLGSNRYG